MQEPLTEHGSTQRAPLMLPTVANKVATPCEDEAAEGGEPHGWGESDAPHGRELERPPVAARQVVGVAHVESWLRNIYASKLPRNNFRPIFGYSDLVRSWRAYNTRGSFWVQVECSIPRPQAITALVYIAVGYLEKQEWKF